MANTTAGRDTERLIYLLACSATHFPIYNSSILRLKNMHVLTIIW